jgi:hypothetical protein
MWVSERVWGQAPGIFSIDGKFTSMQTIGYNIYSDWEGSRDSSVIIVSRLRTGRHDFDSRQRQRFFFISAARAALGPTQPPTNVYWCKASGAWSHSLSSIYCRGWKCVKLYLHSPYVFMASYFVKHRDNYTLPCREWEDFRNPKSITRLIIIFTTGVGNLHVPVSPSHLFLGRPASLLPLGLNAVLVFMSSYYPFFLQMLLNFVFYWTHF